MVGHSWEGARNTMGSHRLEIKRSQELNENRSVKAKNTGNTSVKGRADGYAEA